MRILLSLIGISLLLSCKPDATKSTERYHEISGQTMGTYYKITSKYPDSLVTSVMIKAIVDGTLKEINQAVSTYIKDSDISQINQSIVNEPFAINDKHLSYNLDRALYWYEATGGYMDISVMPLVNYWGFGYHKKKAVKDVDSSAVDKVRQLVGLDKWLLSERAIVKKYDDAQEIDMSALAKGYAVDYIAHILETFGSENYLVDIGGEAVAKGVNAKGHIWTLGISTPSPDADMRDVELIVKLDNKSMASSGNYRNFHRVGDQIYGHTIDPKTGYPYQDSLLGVSIITEECIDADAIATSCMAMGYAKAATFIASQPDVSACFLVGSSDGTINTRLANGFIRYVVE